MRRVLSVAPANANGKLDRNTLTSSDFAAGVSGRPARTHRERTLYAIFAEVPDLPSVGIDDDFFAIGAHSLLATRVVSRVREPWGKVEYANAVHASDGGRAGDA